MKSLRIPSVFAGRPYIIWLLLFAGVVARLILASFGYTYDMESYALVGDLVTHGQNVYAHTSRYNYGPAWMYLVGALYKLSLLFPYSIAVFRFGITLFLSIVDIGIFLVLRRQWGVAAGLIYFLNPLTIILTGYNSHFDNAALLVGMIAVALYAKGEKEKTNSGAIAAFLILGVSLVIKHVFLIFPLWIFIREKTWKRRMLALVIPYGLFLLSFVPFLKDGANGILNNVFLYVSFKNAPLWNVLILNGFPRIFTEFTFFAASMTAGAIAFRKKKIWESLLYYLAMLIIFSPAIADQYFTLVLPVIAVFPNVFFAMFTLIQILYSWIVISGGEIYSEFLGRTLDRSAIGYQLQVLSLLAGLTYTVARPAWKRWKAVHWIRFLVALHLCFVIFVVLPGYMQDKKVAPVVRAIEKGDYESANMLYGRLEREGILAGSGLYNRLSRARYYITYYRTYRNIRDIVPKARTAADWERIRRELKGMPADFAWRDDVERIMNLSDSNLKGMQL